jgi:hypothetical protein
MRVGLVKQWEVEYEQRAELSAIVNFDVGTGEIIESSLRPTRTAELYGSYYPKTGTRFIGRLVDVAEETSGTSKSMPL